MKGAPVGAIGVRRGRMLDRDDWQPSTRSERPQGRQDHRMRWAPRGLSALDEIELMLGVQVTSAYNPASILSGALPFGGTSAGIAVRRQVTARLATETPQTASPAHHPLAHAHWKL